MTLPRWAAALVRLIATPGRAEDAIGDLTEMYRRRVNSRGVFLAKALTTLSVIDMSFALLRQRTQGLDVGLSHDGGDPMVSLRPDPNYRRWDVRRILDDWIRDFLQAARSLARSPGFAVVTVTTLALAIGANTAIFSVIESVLLNPLDYPAADRLVSIRATAPGSDLPPEFGPAPEFYIQYREQADLLEDLGMYAGGQTTVQADDNIERLFIAQSTNSLFSTLGAVPALGRLPNDQDESGTVALISHRLWGDWFGLNPDVVGRSIEVSGRMHTVIGVMPPEFRFPDQRISVWMHRVFDDDAEIRPGNFGLGFVGRVRPGTDLEALESQLDILAARLPERFGGPAQYVDIIERHQSVVRTLAEELVGSFKGPLWLLMGAVGIILLIACANVANLFSVRAESRRHDLGVRQALGAGRRGLVRVQMAEALVLAVLGGVGGVLVARLGVPLLVRVAPENIPNLDMTGVDGSALVFTGVIALVTALAFGLGPALSSSDADVSETMRQAGGIGGGGGRTRGRDTLVLVQTAAALVLLVGSGLLFRSFWTLSNVDPGFETENIFSFQVAPDRDHLVDGPSYAEFHRGFMEEVAALPGVESVGLVATLPLDEGAGRQRFQTEESLLSGETPPPVRFTMAGGDYFETMGIDLLQGRLFDASDHVVGAATILVSAETADRLWPNEDAVGRRLIRAADTTMAFTVVGVVEDIFLDDFRQDTPDPMVYGAMVGPEADTWAVGSPAYVVKSPRADVLAPDVRALMRRSVPESPMYRVFTMEYLADRSMAQLSFTMLMLAVASGLALVLGAVGTYGVLSYVVTSRRREIAVRLALGAEGGAVRRMVVAEGARLAMMGVGAGLFAALLITRVLNSLLFGVGALDLPTFFAMAGLMMLVALLACYIPAYRASTVDPMHVLRAE
ncbi:MAG: ADOP family duplicated permease [Longimicrobiales bacterium]